MKKMKKFLKYFLAMLLPLAVLLIRPITPAAVLVLGREIRLATVPVDPRDVFRGDYVTLSFAIEQLDENLISAEDREFLESRVYYWETSLGAPRTFAYVTLEPDAAGIWQAVRVSITPPENGVYLRAEMNYAGDLDYGDYLKRYYVKENTGLELEEAARRGEITATAKAWRGRAVLTGLETKEEPR